MKPHPIHKSLGFTLTELLIVLAIAGILFGAGSSTWHEAVQRERAKQVAGSIMRAVHIARTSSIQQRAWVTVCPSQDGQHCSQNWANAILAFVDRNRDTLLDEEDRVLWHFHPPFPDGQLQWRSFQRKPYLQMTPRGRTNHQNGSFVWCPPGGDTRFAKVVIVNKPGHTRTSQDSDGDGRANLRSGKPVVCPV